MGYHLDDDGRFRGKHGLHADLIAISFRHPRAWRGLELIAHDYAAIDPELAEDIRERLITVRAELEF